MSGIDEAWINVGAIRLHVRRCGNGPLLLLLHGWPQTSYCWRHVMPELGRHFTVVAPDLRGYGQSSRPRHGYDKRTMAGDISGLMHALGFTSAIVVGHDRGARVAHRWGLDKPGEISRLGLLSVVPTREMWRRMDARLAATYWHWLFHLIPDLPECLTEGKAETYIRFMYSRGAVRLDGFPEHDLRHYIDSFSAPGALRASFDDYRAAYAEDRVADDADAATGRRLDMPVLVLWGEAGLAGGLPVLDIWRDYAIHMQGYPIHDCGHFPAEEQPRQLLDRLIPFLTEATPSCAP
jgi:haloacetate dehalogenase